MSSLLDSSSHGLHHFRNALIHLAKNLVALWLVILDEVTSLPECVACFTKWFWLKAQLRLDDSAHHQTTIVGASAQNAPHVDYVAGWSIKQPQVGRREVDVIDLAILNISHALIVANAKRQNGTHHGTAIDNVSVEQQCWVCDLHLFVVWVNVINQSIDLSLITVFDSTFFSADSLICLLT